MGAHEDKTVEGGAISGRTGIPSRRGRQAEPTPGRCIDIDASECPARRMVPAVSEARSVAGNRVGASNEHELRRIVCAERPAGQTQQDSGKQMLSKRTRAEKS